MNKVDLFLGAKISLPVLKSGETLIFTETYHGAKDLRSLVVDSLAQGEVLRSILDVRNVFFNDLPTDIKLGELMVPSSENANEDNLKAAFSRIEKRGGDVSLVLLQQLVAHETFDQKINFADVLFKQDEYFFVNNYLIPAINSNSGFSLNEYKFARLFLSSRTGDEVKKIFLLIDYKKIDDKSFISLLAGIPVKRELIKAFMDLSCNKQEDMPEDKEVFAQLVLFNILANDSTVIEKDPYLDDENNPYNVLYKTLENKTTYPVFCHVLANQYGFHCTPLFLETLKENDEGDSHRMKKIVAIDLLNSVLKEQCVDHLSEFISKTLDDDLKSFAILQMAKFSGERGKKEVIKLIKDDMEFSSPSVAMVFVFRTLLLDPGMSPLFKEFLFDVYPEKGIEQCLEKNEDLTLSKMYQSAGVPDISEQTYTGNDVFEEFLKTIPLSYFGHLWKYGNGIEAYTGEVIDQDMEVLRANIKSVFNYASRRHPELTKSLFIGGLSSTGDIRDFVLGMSGIKYLETPKQ